MAKKITLTSGSILAGNPIILSIQPETLNNPSFHRIIVEVTFSNLEDDYETVKFTVPVTQEKAGYEVSLDISSALRVPLDSYEYTPAPTTYPVISWYVRAYDEYMNNNGDVHTGVNEVYFPQKPQAGENTNLRCIAGTFSDLERLKSGVTKAVTSLSAKPTGVPELTVVGDSFVYPVDYATPQRLSQSASLEAPASAEEKITQEGNQVIHGHPVYAIPTREAGKRTTFRFVNRYGLLESISIPRAHIQKMSVETTAYTLTKQETFNSFSRSATQKQNDRESWTFQTDPLAPSWKQWYYHEFLMSEKYWMLVENTWLPCTITLEDEVVIKDLTALNMPAITFTATLGINGSPVV